MMPLPFIKLPSRSFRRTLESEDSDDCETDASSEGTDSTFDTRSATSGIHYLRHRSCRVMPPGLDNLGRKKSATSSLSPSSDDTIDSTSCTTATASKTYSSSYFSTSTSFTKSQSTGTISERTSSTRSASSFSFNELDPENVVDPKTGTNIFAKYDQEMEVALGTKPGLPTLEVADASVANSFSSTAETGISITPPSFKSGRAYQSTVRSLKRARRTGLLALKIGEVVITKGLVSPILRRCVHGWKHFHSFRERSRVNRRSKTLDWFEDRAKALRQAEKDRRDLEQTKQQVLERTLLKKHREEQRRRDSVVEMKNEIKARSDFTMKRFKEKQRAMEYFMRNNDNWQMERLTRQVDDNDERRKKQREDQQAAVVRDAELRRKAAASAYMAEYLEGEGMTQEILSLMRRSGIIAGVNTPQEDSRDLPLETDKYLTLRLKAELHQAGTETAGPSSRQRATTNHTSDERKARQSSASVSISHPGITPAGQNLIEGSDIPPGTDRGTTLTEPELQGDEITIAPSSNAQAREGSNTPPGRAHSEQPATSPPATPSSRDRTKKHKRGKKQSSGAFEVDLLRFRSLEQIQGWQLGPMGGEMLAVDLANGACPRLRALRLSWCHLGDRGSRAIVRALSSGGGASAAGRVLQELNFRGNGLTAGGSKFLGEALSAGALPSLRGLDLGANALRDEGGKAIAHHLFAGSGSWQRLVRLDLSGNGMTDIGVGAVFKAVTAPGVHLAPDVERISIRDNFASPVTRRLAMRPPAFLHM